MDIFFDFGKLDCFASGINFFIYYNNRYQFFIKNFSYSERKFNRFKENRELIFKDGSVKVVEFHLNEMNYFLIIDKKHYKKSEELIEKFLLLAELFSLKTDIKLDSATSLNNKKSFINELDKRVEKLKLVEEFDDYINISVQNDKKLFLIMFDIDHFKKFNDDYGHLIGDMVIYKVSSVLKNIAKKYDGFAARYGGEEFSLIINSSSSNMVKNISEEIRKRVLDLRLKDENNRDIRQISVSLGYSFLTPNNNSEKTSFLRDKLISEADMALYSAKRNGRNQTFSFENIKYREGRVLKVINDEFLIISLGKKQNVKVGDKFKIIHKDFNGEKEVVDLETKKKIGITPEIEKGFIKVINPASSRSNMGNMISMGMVTKLNRGFTLAEGDYLRFEPEFPEFEMDDEFDFEISLGNGKFRDYDSISNELEKGKNSLFILKIDKFESKKIEKGINYFKKFLNNIDEEFKKAGIDLIPISSDKAIFFIDKKGKKLMDKIETIMDKNDLFILTLHRDISIDYEIFNILKSMFSTIIFDKKIEVINLDTIIKYAAYFYKMRRYEYSEWILEKFRNKILKKSSYHNLMGGIYFQRRDFINAYKYFKKAVKLDGNNFLNWMNYGIVSLNLNFIDEAGIAFKKSVELKKDSSQANNNYAHFLLMVDGQEEIALKFAKNAVKYSKNNRAKVIYEDTLAHALIKLKRFDEAIEILENSLLVRDDVVDIYVHLYEAYSKVGKKDKAEIYLEKVREMALDHPISG